MYAARPRRPAASSRAPCTSSFPHCPRARPSWTPERHGCFIACRARARRKAVPFWHSMASGACIISTAASPPGPGPDYPSAKEPVMEQALHVDREVDARGLNCPLPILRTKKALNDMASGQVLRVLATDPGSVRDFEAFAKQTGNQLLQFAEQDGVFSFLIKRKEARLGLRRAVE